MKLAVNTVIFGLNQALAEGLVLAELGRHRPAAAYDVLAASAVGAPYVGYKRAAFLEPDGDPGGVLARPRRQGPAADRRARRAVGVAMPRRGVDLAVIRAASPRRPRRRDFSAVAAELRARARPAAAGARAHEEGRPLTDRCPGAAGARPTATPVAPMSRRGGTHD